MELFRKKDSRFYWYDFKVRGKRYRGSTKETNKKRAGSVAALRFSQAIEGMRLLERKAPSLQELSTRFLGWVESAALESKTGKYYANGWRLLSSRTIAGMRLDHIAKDHVEALRFGSSAANLNCALRALRRMLHKGEEWNLLIKVPKFKLWPEQGRKLRLDEDAEQKLLAAAKSCNWKPPMFELFPDVIILARDEGIIEIAAGRLTRSPHSGRASTFEQRLCAPAKREGLPSECVAWPSLRLLPLATLAFLYELVHLNY